MRIPRPGQRTVLLLSVALLLTVPAAGVAGAQSPALAATAADQPPAWPLAVAVVVSVAVGLWWTTRRRR